MAMATTLETLKDALAKCDGCVEALTEVELLDERHAAKTLLEPWELAENAFIIEANNFDKALRAHIDGGKRGLEKTEKLRSVIMMAIRNLYEQVRLEQANLLPKVKPDDTLLQETRELQLAIGRLRALYHSPNLNEEDLAPEIMKALLVDHKRFYLLSPTRWQTFLEAVANACDVVGIPSAASYFRTWNEGQRLEQDLAHVKENIENIKRVKFNK